MVNRPNSPYSNTILGKYLFNLSSGRLANDAAWKPRLKPAGGEGKDASVAEGLPKYDSMYYPNYFFDDVVAPWDLKKKKLRRICVANSRGGGGLRKKGLS